MPETRLLFYHGEQLGSSRANPLLMQQKERSIPPPPPRPLPKPFSVLLICVHTSVLLGGVHWSCSQYRRALVPGLLKCTGWRVGLSQKLRKPLPRHPGTPQVQVSWAQPGFLACEWLSGDAHFLSSSLQQHRAQPLPVRVPVSRKMGVGSGFDLPWLGLVHAGVQGVA